MTEHTQPDLTVIYDGECGVCSRSVLWAAARDAGGRLRFVPNQTADLAAIAPGLTRAEAAKSVYAARPDGTTYHGARAIFEMLRCLPGVWHVVGWIGALPPLSLLAEPVYRVFAHNRGRVSAWFGLTQCRVAPRDGAESGRRMQHESTTDA